MSKVSLSLLLVIVLLNLLISQTAHSSSHLSNVSESGHGGKAVQIQTLMYKDHAPIIIASNTDFLAHDWPGTGTESDPFLIENLSITTTGVGISISDTTAFFEIKNCLINGSSSRSFDGILLKNVTHGSVINTEVDRAQYGIRVQNSSSCLIANNTSVGGTFGFLLLQSSSCNLTYNIASENAWSGFLVSSSNSIVLSGNRAFQNAKSGFHVNSAGGSILIRNIASENAWSGFLLELSDSCVLVQNTATHNARNGFSMRNSSEGVLSGNTARSNSRSGFILESCNSNLLRNNTSEGNSNYGIYIDEHSSLNRVYWNHIGFNGQHNGRDDGRSNSWDDGLALGNHWSDYSGVDDYEIFGIAGSIDRYPAELNGLNLEWMILPMAVTIAIICLILGVLHLRRKSKPNQDSANLLASNNCSCYLSF